MRYERCERYGSLCEGSKFTGSLSWELIECCGEGFTCSSLFFVFLHVMLRRKVKCVEVLVFKVDFFLYQVLQDLLALTGMRLVQWVNYRACSKRFDPHYGPSLQLRTLLEISCITLRASFMCRPGVGLMAKWPS